MQRRSVCSLQTASRFPVTPAAWSSRPVRRVSSQQISAAAASASIALGDRSPRLPIGVETSSNSVAVAHLDDVADRKSPPLERTGRRFDDPAGRP